MKVFQTAIAEGGEPTREEASFLIWMTITLLDKLFSFAFGTGYVHPTRLGCFNHPSQLSLSTTYSIYIGFEQSNVIITHQDHISPSIASSTSGLNILSG